LCVCTDTWFNSDDECPHLAGRAAIEVGGELAVRGNMLVTGGSAGQGPLGADCNTAYVAFTAEGAKVQVGGNAVITSGSASSASVFGSGKRPPPLLYCVPTKVSTADAAPPKRQMEERV
jgi:hypothetical protein